MSGRPTQPSAAAIVVAAGKGLRVGLGVPKQFVSYRGKPVVRHSVEALAAHGIAPIIVVIPEDCGELAAQALDGMQQVRCVTGGETRQRSVANGLEALAGDAPTHVLIHDAARPNLSATVIDRLLAALENHDGAIPVLPVVDSLLQVANGIMGEPVDRDVLRRVQTPQAFRFDVMAEAHRQWHGNAIAGDDAQVARAAGYAVALVEGDEALHKLTFAADFASEAPTVRLGTGYDVHRLGEDEELWLCGVRIEHSHGLVGHSDADVAIHALVDAMLGALGAGDIGQHFSPSDPQWSGAASKRFLTHAASLVADAGYKLGNADITIICEAPKIAPHRQAMLTRLAAILDVDISVLNVKATTTEGLGFTGRGEGIAAQAAVSLVRN
ncbi:MAG: bifunctional 2-C-methyl-D-erythritol 4-phosphate cytidylyltransferase/2-C-methyl-D-erythritol 2,4-cyclodiphosphate synthase [Novosphingobium sp.]|nr:bifunctional 2-C-methyl-D-erythritol 4-phosphate cytidylyltransferase/2-C-methyl-D-erythritol 2,4-cyclodiphosphate synthase [Novosphingobium sp.]